MDNPTDTAKELSEIEEKINAILAMYANYIQNTGGSERFRIDETQAKAAIEALIAREVVKGKIDQTETLLTIMEIWLLDNTGAYRAIKKGLVQLNRIGGDKDGQS